jgi:hypothetical protein
MTVSSLLIVSVPAPFAIFAFTAFDSDTVDVSSGSMLVSPVTLTGIVFDVSPGPNVSVPLAAAKSLPAFAVPSAVA